MNQSESQYCIPADINHAVNLNTKLVLLHINIRSIQRNFSKLEYFLQEISSIPDIIFLSETWTTQDSFFNPSLPGYTFLTQPSLSKAGGVAMFVKSTIKFQMRTDLTVTSSLFESLWIETKYTNKKTEVFGVIYRHPNVNIPEFQDYFVKTIYKINKNNKSLYVFGDFNIDLLKQQHQPYINSITGLGCQQTVSVPTRIDTIRKTKSTIDHLYTNQSDHQIITKVVIHDISDHFPILATIQSSSSGNKNPSKTCFIRDMKNFNSNDYLQELENKFRTINYDNGNDSFDTFLNYLKCITDKHAPIRKLSRKERKIRKKPWMTSGILRSIKRKNLLLQEYINSQCPVSHYMYKTYRNCLTRVKEASKRMYCDKRMENGSKNSKLIWQTINEILMNKPSKSLNLTSIKDQSDTLHTDTQEISDVLNHHFTHIGATMQAKIPKQDYPKLPSQVSSSIYLKPFKVTDVFNHIKNVNIKKSVRPEDVPLKFIKLAADIIAPVITKIFNVCIDQNIFPDNLKQACVIPIHKKGDRTICGNYRPISILSIFSKIFEKCLYEQLNSFFTKYNLIHTNQFGFQKNTSTEMAVSKMYQQYVSNMQKGQITCSIFLDIAKAFDSVEHEILLTKLYS